MAINMDTQPALEDQWPGEKNKTVSTAPNAALFSNPTKIEVVVIIFSTEDIYHSIYCVYMCFFFKPVENLFFNNKTFKEKTRWQFSGLLLY